MQRLAEAPKVTDVLIYAPQKMEENRDKKKDSKSDDHSKSEDANEKEDESIDEDVESNPCQPTQGEPVLTGGNISIDLVIEIDEGDEILIRWDDAIGPCTVKPDTSEVENTELGSGEKLVDLNRTGNFEFSKKR